MTTLICNCNQTMPLNARALGEALDEDLTLHTTLCRRDAPAFQQASRHPDELVVACTQESRLFTELAGETDLKAETQDLRVVVRPELGTVATVGAALVNPVAGAATLIASSVISNPLNRLFSYRYHVTGSWADPKVDSSGILPGPAVEVPEDAVAPAKQNEE